MSSLSSGSVLYSSDGYELASTNGSVINSGTRGILVEGSDGTNAHFISTDASGRTVVVGSGVSGAITIQGTGNSGVVPVSGSITGSGNFTIVQPTAANLNATVIISGITSGTKIPVITDTSSTGTITSVVGSTSNTLVLKSNDNRIMATIFNATNKTMYVALGANASLTSYTLQILPGSYWELPISYTGIINAVWASGVSSSAMITELT